MNNASMGTKLEGGAYFASPATLPHRLCGIVITPKARIGSNAIKFHQVTIGNDYRLHENSPTIGDNVVIYPGAKIVGKLSVGDNCEIGANAVVTHDVPANTLVVCERVRLIDKKAK